MSRIGLVAALLVGYCACAGTQKPGAGSDGGVGTEEINSGSGGNSAGGAVSGATGGSGGVGNSGGAQSGVGGTAKGAGGGDGSGGKAGSASGSGGASSGGGKSGAGGTSTASGGRTGSGGAAVDAAPFVQPTGHPYISLTDYDATDKSGSAYTRLKSAVDDVVQITSAQPANTSYSALSDKITKNHYGYSCVDAIVLYRLTQDTKYVTQAITLMDAFVTQENAAIASNTNPTIAGDSYLKVGDYLEQIALAYDYGYALLSTTQRQNWETYASQAIQNVWNPNSAKWGTRSATWSGWATNDPGDNYYYSFTKATMLWAIATQSQTWLTFMKTNIGTQLDTYFSSLKGGGSREGTGYGTSLGSLFENYRYWRSSTGADLTTSTSHPRETIDYWLHATVPTLQYFASIGDQARSSMTSMFDYQRHLMIEAVHLNPASAEGARGAWWLNHVPVLDGSNKPVYGQMVYGYDFRYDLLVDPAVAEQAPTALAYYSQGTGVMFARSGWTSSDSWMHTIAGIYDQSHAHQDQGSFSLFKGTWLAATANLVSHSGLHSETSAHNVVRFDDSSGNPVPQSNSTSTMTSSDADGVLTITEDLSPAYAKSSASVSSWTRTLVYTRSAHKLDIHDTCKIGSTIKPVFQVILPLQTTAPSVSGAVVSAGNLTITQVTPAVTSSNAPKVVSLQSLPSSDFTGGYRIELTGSGCEFKVTVQAQ